MKTTDVEFFVASCSEAPNMSTSLREELKAYTVFNTIEWLEIRKRCRRIRWLRNFAMKKAVENASTLADWVAIADNAHATGLLRKRAYGEVLRFEPTDGDIEALQKCRSKHLQSVGWYLAGRREISG
jgi:hypothetical protein